MGESYRDHLFHVVDVCLLGYFLLNCGVSCPPGTGKDEFGASLASFCALDLQPLLQNWFVASLLHDLGRSGEVVRLRHLPTQLIRRTGPLRAFLERVDEATGKEVESLREHIRSERRPPLATLAIPEGWVNHGVLSALVVEDVLEATGRPELRDLFVPALVACAKHDLLDEPMNLKTEPVSFLLRICDQIQDWGRPRLDPGGAGLGLAVAVRYWSPGVFALRRSTRHLRVEGGISEQALLVKAAPLVVRVLRYRAEHGLSELAPSWVLLCYALQKLDGAGFFDLELHIDTPRSRELGDLPWPETEMGVLDEYVRSRAGAEGPRLTEFLAAARLTGDGAIRYHPPSADANEPERLTVHLCKLHGRKPTLIERLPRDFYSDFVQWKWRRLAELRSRSVAGPWPDPTQR